ncbi:MAG: ammonium transporter, partial [Acidimicrobiia bacterium]|nr:ammonium transporter [Acidimicrobiia bacterium]
MESVTQSGNIAWVLISAALVLFMTPGLAFFYGGMDRNRNVLNMLLMNFYCVLVIPVLWVAVGYSLSQVPFDNDFIGRSWDGFVYCEGNAVDGTSDQLYIGKLRGSRLFVYAEETVSTGYEIFIGANCEFLDVVDTRETGTVNNAALSCRISRGNKQLVVGDTSFYGYIDCVNLTNSSAKYADLVYETSEGT